MNEERALNFWRGGGVAALFAVFLLLAWYGQGEKKRLAAKQSAGPDQNATFVGSEKCKDCHQNEYKKWSDSHHRWAMQVATPATVKGDFKNATFDYFGRKSRFYRKGDRFYVHTQGAEGKEGDYEITHTFGWYPLQQYLIPFAGGRLQCLPIAWDDRDKKWYHLYPETPVSPDDWLYWTNAAQNWNGMCAECHSTGLRKNYNPATSEYNTSWSEISVGCEACHGPGSKHVKWAATPEMGRLPVPDCALVVSTRNLSSSELIELCAPCHARRLSLDDNSHTSSDFLDYAIPELLSPQRYYVDGQIKDEVYVYGSFMQSKMFARDVSCRDCHDVHSCKRVLEGNDLCLQCHRKSEYDSSTHHFHKKKGEKGKDIKGEEGSVLFEVGSGALCEGCHMPGRNYMGVDYRPDHSLRIPRPDLSLEMDVPNACDRCHVDHPTDWSVQAMKKWYGHFDRAHYGQILNEGRKMSPDAASDLAGLAQDRLYPPIVRGTALSLLGQYPDPQAEKCLFSALADETSLVRWSALRHLPALSREELISQIGPLLYDPVKAVRIEAARIMAFVPRKRLNPDLARRLDLVLGEYVQAMEYTADFAASRHNLGNLYAGTGSSEKAIAEFRKAIEIDSLFYPARVNLALLLNRMGSNQEAVAELKKVVSANPDLYEIKYSLALLLVEMGRPEEALPYLQEASDNLSERGRIHYNLALLLEQLENFSEAEKVFTKAVRCEPDNPDYWYALAVFYINRNDSRRARQTAAFLLDKFPDYKKGQALRPFLQK